jgi:hypothetical protein
MSPVRRRLVFIVAALVGIVTAAVLVRIVDREPAPSTENLSEASEAEIEARFAAYKPAREPNGDLARVVWPEFVLAAAPEVKALYEFQVTHGDLMRYMPCFCGCGNSGHRNNRDCYIRRVNADGSVEFDSMAPT